MDHIQPEKKCAAYFALPQMPEQWRHTLRIELVVQQLADLFLIRYMVHGYLSFIYGASISLKAARDLKILDFTALSVVPVTAAIAS